jgi:glyoxylase-like metal-dependent hydrolase (beta-lactamase superfamily II)
VIELAPGIHRLGHRAGGRVSAFLIDDGGELSLVDTLFENDGRLVLEAIRELGKSVTDLKRIAITHGHRSHLGGLAALKRASGATVYAHAWEADIVSGDRRAQPVTLLPKQSVRLLPFQLGLRLNRPKHSPCPVEETLDDDEAFGPLRVLHAPGHTPGHLAFFWPERSILITGDAVATWPSFCAGWTAFNLNRKQQAASVRRMAALEARIVGVGHGEPITEDAPDRLHSLAVDQ